MSSAEGERRYTTADVAEFKRFAEWAEQNAEMNQRILRESMNDQRPRLSREDVASIEAETAKSLAKAAHYRDLVRRHGG